MANIKGKKRDELAKILDITDQLHSSFDLFCPQVNTLLLES